MKAPGYGLYIYILKSGAMACSRMVSVFLDSWNSRSSSGCCLRLLMMVLMMLSSENNKN